MVKIGAKSAHALQSIQSAQCPSCDNDHPPPVVNGGSRDYLLSTATTLLPTILSTSVSP